MQNSELASLAIFEGLAPEDMRWVTPLLETCSFAQDDVIFEQGHVAIHLYILLKGEVLVRFKPYDGPVLTVAHIQAGGVFGWSAALGRTTYSSGAVAAECGEAIRIRGEQLRALCEQHPAIGVVVLDQLANVIAERLRSTHGQILDMLTEGMTLSTEWRKRLKRDDRK
jgi:CRP/FNR family transcriptional regulator, cyclic AMP receptor protein